MILTEELMGVIRYGTRAQIKGILAEVWDEGWIAGADDQKAWRESTPGNRATTVNPYREAG